ncbi:MAG: hypothetical protein FWG99_09640, partial [Treponema sp.]|nr:hypothetical protein [Treponema sp.]
MRFSEEEKAKWLEDWHRSGKRPWTYARENGLCPQTFVKWSKQKEKFKQGFVQVPEKAVNFQQAASEILI